MNRLARALSKIRADRARAVEEIFMRRKLTKNYLHMEILAPYLNNPSEETTFGSNKIKEQHETIKLQKENVMLRNTQNLVGNELNRLGEKLFRKKVFVLSHTNIDKVKIFYVLHDQVALLTRRCSELGTRNRHQRIVKKIFTIYIQKMLIKG